jgi:hypothetical protein
METIDSYKSRFLASPMTWEFVSGEFDELVEAIQERDIDHIREEWNDVTLCFQAWLSRVLPIGWVPIFPGLGLSSARKFAARRPVWHQIFDHHGVDFRKESLFDGSNFRKKHKVIRVLGRSGVLPEKVDLLWIESLVGGWEPA